MQIIAPNTTIAGLAIYIPGVQNDWEPVREMVWPHEEERNRNKNQYPARPNATFLSYVLLLVS